jgi:hypothetical protein
VLAHAGPLALFALLAVAWTWPLVLHLGDAVPGDPGDNYSFLWNLWWMRHVLATPDLPYFHTTYLFYPFGTTIADHPHCALPALVAATLLKPLSIITAYNLLLLAFLFVNMAAMYALAWTILESAGNGVRRRAAMLAAVIFGISPYVAVHLLGHFDLVAVWVLPAFALALHRAVHRGSNRAAFMAGLVLVATAYTAYYYVVYLCLFTVAYLTAWAFHVSVSRAVTPAKPRAVLRYLFLAAAMLFAALGIAIAVTGGGSFYVAGVAVSSRTPQNALTAAWICAFIWLALAWRPRVTWSSRSPAATRRAVAIVSIVVATFVAGAAPLFKEAAYLIARGEYVTPYYGWRSAPRGIDVVAPLLGHPLHPLSRNPSGRAYAAVSADAVEAIAWLGIVPLLIGFLTRRERRGLEDARLWGVVGAVFLIWALGPYLLVGGFDTGLKLPQILARFVPFVANARMPGRAIVVVFMALAVLAAAGLARAPRLQRPAIQWLLIGIVAFEYWDAPIRLTPLDRPAVYQALAAAPPGALCEVPFGIGDGLSVGFGSQDRRILFYATQHEHPLVGGYIGRMPPRAKERIEGMPVAGPLLELSSRPEAARSRPVATADAPEQTCRYLVVNRAASPAAVLSYVQQLPAERIASDESRDLYRLR